MSDWIQLHVLNKNNDKLYITKQIIKIDVYENNDINVFHDGSEYIEYKDLLEGYNIVASDLNKLSKIKDYKMSTPDTEYGFIELTISDNSEKETHKTLIYKIYNPSHGELQKIYGLLKSEYLHKCF
jgi:hypothetical protein